MIYSGNFSRMKFILMKMKKKKRLNQGRESPFKLLVKSTKEDESSEEDEDSTAMIARGLKKIFKSKKFDPKTFYKKRFSSKKNDKSSKGNKLLNNKNESNLGSYGLSGHVMKDCPIIQERVEKHKQKAKKEFKKSMIAAWSNSCLLYTSPSPRDGLLSRMPSSA